jgi:alkanesulfonate monooxygenase SsuD/methylene tetrahydromethanopterin reductase-like flavin-dependent oxidoreductase (luciferase family)
VTFQGRFWQLKDAAMEPKPSQKPWPPIWFRGSHPAALRRAIQHGDSFIGAGSQTTAQFADQVKVVREGIGISRASGLVPGANLHLSPSPRRAG